jgi:toxin FitB
MYLIDTNVISELRKLRPHGAVVAWINQVNEELLFISAVTLAEIQRGIEITRTQDKPKALAFETWLDQLAETYQILPMTDKTFRLWAKLMHGMDDKLYEDAMIAATAIEHQLTVVTRNVRDFSFFKVTTLNPFIFK